MSVKIESERKFLVKFPDSWEKLSDLFDNLVDIKRIEQSYLVPKGDEPAERIRKTKEGLSGETSVIYHYNKKKPLETGVHEEEEYEITKKHYEKLLEKSDPKKSEVCKTRFNFMFDKNLFELDIFKGALKGLAILEVELKDIKQKVNLPPFLKIIKEVTSEKNFNNFSLANRQLHD
jgi:CYTH domain-containing protein